MQLCRVLTDSVAELAFGFMISLLRFVVQCDQVTRECMTRAGFIGKDLKGKTLGIIGTGPLECGWRKSVKSSAAS